MKTLKLFAAFAIVSIALISGCKKDNFVERTGVCPIVVSTVPTNLAVGVPITQILSVTFNEKMNPATITTASFSLTGISKIPGILVYDGTTPTFSFTPSAPLAYSTTYTGKVMAGVKDMDGNALQKDYVWSFTTAAQQFTLAVAPIPVAGGTVTGGGTYNSGTSVTAAATPNPGYTFTNWTEGVNVVSTNASYAFSITGNRTLVANFTLSIVNFTLTLSSNPAAGGTTTGGGSYNSGTSVTAAATPNPGFTFTNWTEGVNVVSTNASYTFSITGNRTLVANFSQTVSIFTVTLSSNPVAGGTTTGGGSYDSGVSVTVNASANSGFVFKNWTEGGNIVSTNAGYTFTIAGNRILVANFTETVSIFTVTLSSNPVAGGTTTGGGSYNSGVSVTVNASANSGFVFKNWTEGGNIVSTNAGYTFTITGNRILVANFTESVNTVILTLSSNPPAGGTTTGGGSYDSGTSVTAGATANVGYTFTNWTEGVNIVSTNVNYTFNITGNRTLVANFSQNAVLFTLALSSNPLAGGNTTGAGSYNSGASVTAGATTNAGYTFTNWTEGANIVSTNASYTFTITANRTLVANFTQNAVLFTLNVTAVNGSVVKNPDQSTYASGTSVELIASADIGYTFTSWSVDASGSANPYIIVMNANKNVTANFTKNPVGPGVVDLGTAGNYVILTKSGISTTGVTSITGNIAVSPVAATAITGFGLIMDATNTFSHTPIVTGRVYAADYAAPTPANLTTAVSDMETAFTTANNLVTPAPIVDLYAGDISGRILPPGLYKWSTGVLITSAGVTLAGGPEDTWVFQIAQNFTVSNSAIITLSGGAQAKNIFWVVAGQATLGTNADLSGNILSQTLISLNTGARVLGRLLAQTAVTLNASTVIIP